MKTYRIQLSAEDQKKLEQVLKALKYSNLDSYFREALQKQWINLV